MQAFDYGLTVSAQAINAVYLSKRISHHPNYLDYGVPVIEKVKLPL